MMETKTQRPAKKRSRGKATSHHDEHSFGKFIQRNGELTGFNQNSPEHSTFQAFI
jgi:hypothetical protein